MPLRCRGLAPHLVALLLFTPGVPAAGPALEYAPEIEASFLARCAGPDMMTDAAAPCRRRMERLQAALGYAAFLEHAAAGPTTFSEADDRRLTAVALPPPVVAPVAYRSGAPPR